MTQLIEKIRTSIIGEGVRIKTPFGLRPLIYADYTASGRSLRFIENYIQDQVLPYYANTHTETSFTGSYTTTLREQARQTIHSAVNARDADHVIFCGAGATAAISKLMDILNLRIPNDLDRQYGLSQQIPEKQRPVMFISPYEHHSNELPWRESIAELVTIPLARDGRLDIDALDHALQKYQSRITKIGSFSAASNVTGIKTNVDAVSRLLHQYGALSFWDYAAAAPYTAIDMRGNQQAAGDTSKDAVFISPHKFIGGPGTPGVLIVNDGLLTNSVPSVPGGGTVLYVNPEDHSYLKNVERREEGGTPAIVESIRAGLVFKLQQAVGTKKIEALENGFIKRAIERWSANANIDILGSHSAPRISIVSLRIKWQQKELHYGFVTALLNDLFGIQARGGCACAGPYAHILLDMEISYSRQLEQEIERGTRILRPGWVRMNFNYFIDEDCFEYLLRSVELIANHGWRLLPYYNYNTSTDTWRYQDCEKLAEPCLPDFSSDCLAAPGTVSSDVDIPFHQLLQDAEEILLKDRRVERRFEIKLDKKAETLRWFATPQEASTELDRLISE
ncbi:MAG: aminotransferase class V-fold PLP-dependent enzyme [Cellvibrionales bacterium]|nr:aminotransferase class V-fold PLP-dependent enzyme [Cellvibrionales bacterium]